MVATGAMAQVINTFPYNQDFEGEGASTACNGYTMLSAGWFNDNTDVNDWVPDAGGTTSSATGPTMDYNPGSAIGKYMYTETSGCSNDVRNLETPWFDFSSSSGLELSFAYHMYGATMGTMAVDYRTGLGSAWTSLVAPWTDNQNAWQILINDISFLGGEDSVRFRIVASTGTSFTSDMAIDDFSIVEVAFTASVTYHQDNYCFGQSTGELTATPAYGVAPYTYSWDNGGTTATISGLAAGTYCCTITDDIGQMFVVCDVISDLGTTAMNVYTHTLNDWICTDSMGGLVIDSITGGSPGLPLCGTLGLGCSGTSTNIPSDVSNAANTGTTYPSPLGNWYWGTRHQMAYTPSELLAAGVQPGNISGIGFEIQSMGTAAPSLTGFTIAMGCSSDSVMTNYMPTTEVMAATNVTIAAGMNYFTFDTPFFWDGTSVIIVETCFNNSGFTNNPVMSLATTAYTSCIYYRADATNVCGNAAITGTSMSRPVIEFENCAFAPTPTYYYSWNNGSSADTTMVLAGTYTLTVEDFVGCMDSVTYTLFESAPVNVDDALICDNNPYVLQATPGFDTYLWNTAETGSAINIMTGGTFFVDVVDSLGCMSSDTAVISTIPGPVLAASPSPETYGMDGAIYLSIYSSTAAFPFTVDWDTDGTGDNDDTENQFYLTAGDYTVVVTDANGCYTELTVTVSSQVSVGEEQMSEFTVYPNPSTGHLFIQPLTVMGENVTGQITDASGRVVETIAFNGTQLVEVDLTGQERGIYFLTITVDGSQTITKIVLQ